MHLKKFRNNLLYIFIAVCITVFSTSFCFAQPNEVSAVENKKPATTSLIPSKKENKNILGKFFITMLWVLGSCAAIYGGLLVYKKVKNPSSLNEIEEKDISKNLDSPETINDAMDFVIKKF